MKAKAAMVLNMDPAPVVVAKVAVTDPSL